MFKLRELNSALWGQTRITVVKAHSVVKVSWQYSSFLLVVSWVTRLLISLSYFHTILVITELQTAHVPPHTVSLFSPDGMRSLPCLANCNCRQLPVNFSQWSYSSLLHNYFISFSSTAERNSFLCIYKVETQLRKIRIHCNLPHLLWSFQISACEQSIQRLHCSQYLYRDIYLIWDYINAVWYFYTVLWAMVFLWKHKILKAVYTGKGKI